MVGGPLENKIDVIEYLRKRLFNKRSLLLMTSVGTDFGRGGGRSRKTIGEGVRGGGGRCRSIIGGAGGGAGARTSRIIRG